MGLRPPVNLSNELLARAEVRFFGHRDVISPGQRLQVALILRSVPTCVKNQRKLSYLNNSNNFYSDVNLKYGRLITANAGNSFDLAFMKLPSNPKAKFLSLVASSPRICDCDAGRREQGGGGEEMVVSRVDISCTLLG